MKTNFKKLASSAAVAAALATGSMSAHAIITSVPGEAYLVPFAVATAVGDSDPIYGELDTIVRITVPASIGLDTVFNYTAPHTAPTNPIASGAKEMPAVKGLPVDVRESACADSGGVGNSIHWVFLDSRSKHRLNGDFCVTADDVAVFDWQDMVTANAQLSGVAGYLVFETQGGFEGENANFSFFADAYFTNGVFFTGPTGDIDYWSSVNIPALPLADGADSVGQTKPTLDNNLIMPVSQDAIVSPLVSGIRTSIVDTVDQFTVIDLELANSLGQPFGEVAQYTGSLLVVWNDRNATNWASVGVDVFDDDENRCSTSIELPNELNLVWVPPVNAYDWPTPTSGNIFYETGGPSFLGNKIAGTTQTQGSLSQLCNPSAGGVTPADSFTQYRLNGGFVKARLPEPKQLGQTAVEQSAAAAFTINFNFGLIGDLANVSETVLAHDRGKFSQR